MLSYSGHNFANNGFSVKDNQKSFECCIESQGTCLTCGRELRKSISDPQVLIWLIGKFKGNISAGIVTIFL